MDAARGTRLDVARVDLAGARDKEALLERLATALDFPDWFGGNWDALEDCLTDLSGAPGPATVLSATRRAAGGRPGRADRGAGVGRGTLGGARASPSSRCSSTRRAAWRCPSCSGAGPREREAAGVGAGGGAHRRARRAAARARQPPGYWQSVTGSLDRLDEPVAEAARREVLEETGHRGGGRPARALECGQRLRDLREMAPPLRAGYHAQYRARVRLQAAGHACPSRWTRRSTPRTGGCRGARRRRSAFPGRTGTPSACCRRGAAAGMTPAAARGDAEHPQGPVAVQPPRGDP